ncbi:Rv2231c family pyridoxal phosphate-dependent protein CobC [Rhodococcus sp. X156]|uniref:Rv2231c family pyridoxal phosphate-dependent protein CobC n=1 Tax=Rhodococcus sp. X156 TaxID=2499145 RepID=UPI000FD75E80|nr:Rv2231c family pyridoxal phosphate-dependent protein CobC [Rhodococcus sp. X156]
MEDTTGPDCTALDYRALRHHGDVDAEPGLLDFAVNVRGTAPPAWLRERLAARLDDLGAYPSAAEELATREQVAARHGRRPDEVLLLAGAAEGFALLPRLRPRLAAVVHPSFTEPELALREADVPVQRVVLAPPWQLAGAAVPAEADLVVLGNPTNPTSVLHPAEQVLGLRRANRVVVVDEAFADAVPGEPQSLAGQRLPDVLVLRSLTKTWALAGLRAGYVLGPPDLLPRLARGRPHWPLGTLQLEAIRACCEPDAVAWTQREAEAIAVERAEMAALLAPWLCGPAQGPFLLLRVPDGERVRRELRTRGIAVRRGDTFPGLGPDYLRVAVRSSADAHRLTETMTEVLR